MSRGLYFKSKLFKNIIIIIVIFLLSFDNYANAYLDNQRSTDKLVMILMEMNDEERYISNENNFSHGINVNLSGYKKLSRVEISIYYDFSAKKYKNLVNEEYETLDKIKVYNNNKYKENVKFSEASELLGEIDIREYIDRAKKQCFSFELFGKGYKGEFDLISKNEIIGKNSKFVITDYDFEFDRTINDFCIIGFYGYFLTK